MFVNQIYWPVLMLLAFSLRFRLKKIWISSESNWRKMTCWLSFRFWRWMQSWSCWSYVSKPHIFKKMTGFTNRKRARIWWTLCILWSAISFKKKLALDMAKEKPSLCLRYVEDTLVIWPHDLDRLQEFCNHINSLVSAIRFIMDTKLKVRFRFWKCWSLGKDLQWTPNSI